MCLKNYSEVGNRWKCCCWWPKGNHEANKTILWEALQKAKLPKKVNLSTEIPYNDIPKLTENQKQSLEGKISLPELTSALKRMKNNKSPGSDGFTADFFKFFWIDVGKFVFRSFKYGYQQRKISVTQRQGVITCIPKEGRSKKFLKKWRPITLLNSTYKLASSCIAERIKSVLSHLISNAQTGLSQEDTLGTIVLSMIYYILHKKMTFLVYSYLLILKKHLIRFPGHSFMTHWNSLILESLW